MKTLQKKTIENNSLTLGTSLNGDPMSSSHRAPPFMVSSVWRNKSEAPKWRSIISSAIQRIYNQKY